MSYLDLNYKMFYYYNKILVKYLSVLFKLHNVLLLYLSKPVTMEIVEFKLQNVLLQLTSFYY